MTMSYGIKTKTFNFFFSLSPLIDVNVCTDLESTEKSEGSDTFSAGREFKLHRMLEFNR